MSIWSRDISISESEDDTVDKFSNFLSANANLICKKMFKKKPIFVEIHSKKKQHHLENWDFVHLNLVDVIFRKEESKTSCCMYVYSRVCVFKRMYVNSVVSKFRYAKKIEIFFVSFF